MEVQISFLVSALWKVNNLNIFIFYMILPICRLKKYKNLNHATLYPNNFEKKNVTIALNIFNEKTAAFLDLKGYNDTAIFVKAITFLWDCINVKSKDAWSKLRLKLLSKLDIEEVVSHSKEECCISSLTEGEIFMLDEAFPLRSTFSDVEECSFFTYQDMLRSRNAVDDLNLFKNSEFLLLLSCGKLSYPPAELFEQCCILFCYYKSVEKTCTVIGLLVLTKFMKVAN